MKTQINKKVRNKRTTKAKKLNKTKKNNKLNCSPKPKDEINNFSCYSDKSLYKLREVWNVKHPDDQILKTLPKEIHKALSDKIKPIDGAKTFLQEFYKVIKVAGVLALSVTLIVAALKVLGIIH